jgi:protein-S-isoprenylcysteine O-methyltransferase Ste14
MNTFRYDLALVGLLLIPTSVLMWVLVHPFIAFWRRVGLFGTYAVIVAAEVAVAVGLYQVREPLLAVEFGSHWAVLLCGVGTLALAVWLRVRLHRHFSAAQLLGFPELAPDRYPQRLVTEGLHARVRHPRYLQFLLAVAGFALLANYLVLYVMLALLVPAIWLVVILEEKELRRRFGAAYAEYSRRVPRFIPRRGG